MLISNVHRNGYTAEAGNLCDWDTPDLRLVHNLPLCDKGAAMESNPRRYKREKRRFGDLLRSHRVQAGFRTQHELAMDAGASSASEVSNAENGDLSEEMARRLVAAIPAPPPPRWDGMQGLARRFLLPA